MKKIFTTIISLIILASNTEAQTKVFQVDHGETLTNGLISYYKFNGDATDFWGTNNGTDIGITYGTGNGIVNQGAGYNGSNSKIARTPTPLSGTTFTISAWVKPNGALEQSGPIFSESVAGNNSPYIEISIGGWTGNPQLWTTNRDANMIGLTHDIYPVSSYISTGNWIHFVWVCTATNSKLYVNGILRDNTDFTANSFAPNKSYIGVTERAGISYFNGSIDEVGIWNRALTLMEISDLYNGGAGQTMVRANNAIFFGTNF